MTLSQFVDWCDGEYVDLNKYEDIFEEYYVAYEEIINYNNYLKQPLTKDMFINEIEKPKCYNDWLKGNYPTPELMTKCKKYQEAESKVIFKNIKWNGFLWVADGWYKFHISECENLSEMARKTNGELQIHLEL